MEKNPVYIFSGCLEFNPPNSETKEIPEEICDKKDLWPYTYAVATNATFQEYMEKLIPWLEKECRCGDDSFFDYIPAAIDETLQWAAAHGHEFFNHVLEELYHLECLRNTYDRTEDNDPEDTLQFLWDLTQDKEDFLSYFEETVKAEEIYRSLPNEAIL